MRYLCRMNLIRIAIELLVLYLLYKLVFDLILPLTRTTRQVNRQFEDMNRRMQENQATSPPPAGKTTGANGDYIDFEEVK